MATSARSATALRPSLWLALALGLVALSYRGVLGADFVWDDHPLIDEQPLTHEIQPLSTYLTREFWADPANPQSRGFYRPLVALSYALEWQLWNGHPAGFHATNLLVHLACCALVFGLARRLGAGAPAAFLACLLFGLHPRLSESVAWISGRTDVFAALFCLLALRLQASGRPGVGRGVAVALLLLLGLLSKEVAIAGVLAVITGEWVRWRREATPRWSGLATRAAPAAAALLAWGTLRILARAPEPEPPTPFTLVQRLALFPLEGLGRYLGMLLDPFRPRIQIGLLGRTDPTFVAVGGLVAAPLLLALAWLLWRRTDRSLLPWFVLGTVPIAMVLNVIPLPANVVAADRFLYLPLAALAIGLAAATTRLPRAAARPVAVATVALAAALGFTTARHTAVWTDDVTLWEFGVRHAGPDDALPHAQLGYALAWRGRLEEAIECYRRALAIIARAPRLHHARWATAQANLALALSEVGAYEEARQLLQEVLRRRPAFAIHHLQLAAVHARALDFEAARRSVDRALELVPDYAIARQLRARLDETQRRWEALPAETPDEDVAIVAERATVMAHAGRVRDADALWMRVVEHPHASPRLVQRAAVHFAYGGYRPDAAQRAFERLRALGADPIRVARLESVFAGRKILQ